MVDARFRQGADVEVSSDDDGFRGAWFAATIIAPPSRNNKLLVQYKTLTANETGSKPLRETVDLVQIRPIPPREVDRSFNFSEEVDAYYDDGWWEGVIMEVLDNSRYSVFFRGSREQIEFGKSDLRLHREWVYGNWVPPLEEDHGVSPTAEANTCNLAAEKKRKLVDKISAPAVVKICKPTVEEVFSKGTLVEASSDEEGFQGAWFTATIIKSVGKNKFLIEYHSLRTDDDTAFLREEVDVRHLRPCPPKTFVVDSFIQFEEVDAFYNDGWWVGVISKILAGSRYSVYFRGTKDELEFAHSDLRLHQEWIDGKWVIT